MSSSPISRSAGADRVLYCRAPYAGTPLHLAGLLALLSGTCVAGLFSVSERSISTFTVFILFLLVGFLLTRRLGRTQTSLFLLVYSFATLAAVCLYYAYTARYGAPYYIGGSDDLAYELWGQETARQLGIFDYTSIRGTVVEHWHNSVGYVYLVSLLYRLGELLGGFHTMLPRLFNTMCLGLLSVFTYRIARDLQLDKRSAVTVGLLVGLLPIMVYTTVHTFRDVLVSLVFVGGVYVWTPRLNGGRSSRLGRWAITILLVLVLSELRFFQSLALIIVAVVGDVFVRRRESVRGSQPLYALVAMAVAGGFLIRARQDISALAGRLVIMQGRYVGYRTSLTDGLSAYVFQAPLPWGYLLRAGYGLISPLPILTPQIDRLLLSVGTVVQFFFLPFAALGLFVLLRRPAAWPLITGVSLLFGGMMAVTFTDRHVIQFLPYVVILANVGYLRYPRSRVPIGLSWGGFGVVLVVIYSVFRP